MRIKLLQGLIRLLDLLDRVLPKGEIEWEYGGRVIWFLSYTQSSETVRAMPEKVAKRV